MTKSQFIPILIDLLQSLKQYSTTTETPTTAPKNLDVVVSSSFEHQVLRLLSQSCGVVPITNRRSLSGTNRTLPVCEQCSYIYDSGELTIIHNPNGTQQAPDIVVSGPGFKFLIECKSSNEKFALATWNSGKIQPDSIYILKGKNSVTYFLGKHRVSSSYWEKYKAYSEDLIELTNKWKPLFKEEHMMPYSRLMLSDLSSWVTFSVESDLESKLINHLQEHA